MRTCTTQVTEPYDYIINLGVLYYGEGRQVYAYTDIRFFGTYSQEITQTQKGTGKIKTVEGWVY